MKKFILIFTLLLMSCGISVQPVNAQQGNILQAVLVAETPASYIYEFSSNGFLCFVTESKGNLSVAAGISCK